MIFTSTLLAEASGRVGGLIFSHNAGGPYIRAAGTVTNPNTPQQTAIRDILSQLASLWVSTLTEAQRDAWALYAENVSLINRLGSPINVAGLNQYVRSNVPIIQSGFARQDAAPTIFDLGDFTAPGVQGQEAGQDLSVLFTDTDDWVGEDDAALLIYASRPQNPSINFFRGPYQFAGSIDGDGITPPTSPGSVDSPFFITEGQRIFIRSRVIRADGRVSSEAFFQGVVAA